MRSALVVVDMLNDFVDGALANPAAKGVVQPISALAEEVRSREEWTLLYANDAHLSSDVELRVFPPHAMAGTPGAAVIDELRPRENDLVISKRFYSAFSETNLEAVLRDEEVGRLVLVGQHTDCCIRHTSYDAFRLGFELVVCPDATTVFLPGSSEALELRQARALEYLVTYYGARLDATTAL